MGSILEYKGYRTKVEFDAESFVLRGKIEGIKDLVNFESPSIELLEKEFHDAVDDYLEFCKEVGKEPEKEYKGTFNVRIKPDLHRKLAIVAMRNGDNLNTTVEKAIEQFVLDHQGNSRITESVKNFVEAFNTLSLYSNYNACEFKPNNNYNFDNIVPFSKAK